LANLIGKIKWFKLPQIVAPYIFNIFLYAWPAQALVEAVLRYTSLNWFLISLIMFAVGCFVPVFIVIVYRKITFLHCKFFDLLIGVNTAEIPKREQH
jgi:hypothetical protein